MYYFVIVHYKVTTIFANHQIYRHLYFVELTLIRLGHFLFLSFVYRIFRAFADVFLSFVPRLSLEGQAGDKFLSLGEV